MIYLRLVDGTVSYYAELQLKEAVDIDILPFEVGNPFEDYGLNETIKPRGNFGRLDYSTNMLKNYGEDLVTLLIIFGFSLLVSLASIAWSRFGKQASTQGETNQ